MVGYGLGSAASIILEQGENRTFEAFDRFAQFELSKGKSLAELLDEFERLRTEISRPSFVGAD